MRKTCSLLILLFLFTSNYGQNLIKNPSFEDNITDKYNNLHAKDWLIPNLSSVDYYNSLFPSNHYKFFGSLPAIDGNAYVGLCLFDWNGEMEHYTGKITKTLQKDSIYVLSFYIRYASNKAWLYSKKIELMFTNDSNFLSRNSSSTNYRYLFNQNSKLKADIEIDIGDTYKSCEWIKYEALYRAKGGEQYVTFGLFYQNERFNKLINKYLKFYLFDFKKQKDFISKNEEFPIFTNRNVSLKIRERKCDFAYYFIDNISLIQYRQEKEEGEFTY